MKKPVNTLKTAFLTSALLALNVNAAESSSTPGFSGQGEAGFMDSTGNTTSTSIFGSLKLDYIQVNYEVISLLEVNYKSENQVQTQERYRLASQLNHFYTDNHSNYSFAAVKLEKSLFESIELDTNLSIGYGQNLYKTEQSTLTSEISLGQQSIDYISSSSSRDSSQAFAQLKLAFNHKINNQVSFSEKMSYLKTNEQARLESNSAFIIKIANNMNLNFSYKYRHNDRPANGVKNTDTQTLLTLSYRF